jgi:multicomponent Na+:H+ antiporter subunit E
VLLAWLTVVWIALWGDVSIANAVGGLATAVVLVTIFPPERPMRFVARPVAVVRFFVVFTWRLVEASAVVAWEVVTPRNRINEGIVEVPARGTSDLVLTVLANVISLTPGTLTIELDRNRRVLFVHVLHLHDVNEVRRSIRELESLVIRAFGSRRAVAALDVGPDQHPAGWPPAGQPSADRPSADEEEPTR